MKSKRFLPILAAAALITSARFLPVAEARAWLARLSDLGPLAPAVFVAVYIVACILFVPGTILTLGAGTLFGAVLGTIYVSIGSTLGATAAFLIGRYLARDWVRRAMRKDPRFGAIDAAIAKNGWKIVGLVRLSPVFPFNLVNYAFGVTNVRLRDYMAASWLGMLPATILYVYLGSLAGDLAGFSRNARAKTPIEWAFEAAGLAAAIAASVYIARVAKAALREAAAASNPPDLRDAA